MRAKSDVVRYEQILNILQQFDTLYGGARGIGVADADDLRSELAKYFENRRSDQAVLGIDIYRYSHMSPETQQLVPSLFNLLRSEALQKCRSSEGFLFRERDVVGPFVSTGDGGFQVFATPLHAVVFAIFFEMYLAAFNGSFHLPKLRAVFQQTVNVRYALTYDTLFEQDGNVFGAAIINNARIISRDALNRFLLDGKTVDWFRDRFASVESLLTLRSDDLPQIVPAIRASSRSPRSSLFGPSENGSGVKSVHLQKLGLVEAKKRELDVYSLMIQVGVPQNRENSPVEAAGRTAIVTVGNLNPEGIAV